MATVLHVPRAGVVVVWGSIRHRTPTGTHQMGVRIDSWLGGLRKRH